MLYAFQSKEDPNISSLDVPQHDHGTIDSLFIQLGHVRGLVAHDVTSIKCACNLTAHAVALCRNAWAVADTAERNGSREPTNSRRRYSA